MVHTRHYGVVPPIFRYAVTLPTADIDTMGRREEMFRIAPLEDVLHRSVFTTYMVTQYDKLATGGAPDHEFGSGDQLRKHDPKSPKTYELIEADTPLDVQTW